MKGFPFFSRIYQQFLPEKIFRIDETRILRKRCLVPEWPVSFLKKLPSWVNLPLEVVESGKSQNCLFKVAGEILLCPRKLSRDFWGKFSQISHWTLRNLSPTLGFDMKPKTASASWWLHSPFENQSTFHLNLPCLGNITSNGPVIPKHHFLRTKTPSSKGRERHQATKTRRIPGVWYFWRLQVQCTWVNVYWFIHCISKYFDKKYTLWHTLYLFLSFAHKIVISKDLFTLCTFPWQLRNFAQRAPKCSTPAGVKLESTMTMVGCPGWSGISKRTPRYPWNIPQASKKHPNERNSYIKCCSRGMLGNS